MERELRGALNVVQNYPTNSCMNLQSVELVMMKSTTVENVSGLRLIINCIVLDAILSMYWINVQISVYIVEEDATNVIYILKEQMKWIP